MNLSWLIPVHKHLGETLIVLPVVVVIVALLRGGSILPRITAVLLDVQILLGVFTLILVTKSVSVLHIVCMAAALGLAHAFAKKDNRTAVAGAFSGVFALLVLGYLFQRGILPDGGLRLTLH